MEYNIQIPNDEIANRQFKHAYHCDNRRSRQGIEERKDVVFVKELITLKNGEKIDNMRVMIEPKRKFWITKEPHRNHKQKKQWEHIDKLQEFSSTQSDLPYEAVKRMVQPGTYVKNGQTSIRDMNMKPYVYGSDIKVTELIKAHYDDNLSKGEKDLFTTTFFDIETNTLKDEVSAITSIQFNPDDKNELQIFVNIDTSSLNVKPSDEQKIKDVIVKEFNEKVATIKDKNGNVVLGDKKLSFIFTYQETSDKICDDFFLNAHTWGNDWLTAWNSHYDFMTIKRTYEKYGIDIKDRMSYPLLNEEYKEYREKIIPKSKVTRGGVTMSIPPDRRWHLFRAPAPFYCVDMMATYSYLRIMDKVIQGGMSLNNVLDKEGGLQKLTDLGLPEEVNNMTGLAWHRKLTKDHPVEYVIYNIWDVLLMVFLEAKNQDLASTLPIFVNRSNFEDFDSSSKYILNDFHFYALTKNVVIGSSVVGEDYGEGIGRRDFTITLPQWPKSLARSNAFKNAIPYLADSSSLLDTDSDVTAAYPSATTFGNVSKNTTMFELLGMGNIHNHRRWREIPKEEHIPRMKELNVGIFAGKSNHLEYCEWMFNLPNINEFMKEVEEEYGLMIPKFDKEIAKEQRGYTPNVNTVVQTLENDELFVEYLNDRDNVEDIRKFDYLPKNVTLFESKEEFESYGTTPLLEKYVEATNEYQNEAIMNKNKRMVHTMLKADEEVIKDVKGKVFTYGVSVNPKYKQMKEWGVDTSHQRMKNTVVVYENSPKTFVKGNLEHEPNLEAINAVNAPLCNYGGDERRIYVGNINNNSFRRNREIKKRRKEGKDTFHGKVAKKAIEELLG